MHVTVFRVDDNLFRVAFDSLQDFSRDLLRSEFLAMFPFGPARADALNFVDQGEPGLLRDIYVPAA